MIKKSPLFISTELKQNNMDKLTKEQIDNLPEWMPVRDFPNYEVNCREGIIKNIRTLRVRKPSYNRDGYPRVVLYKDGTSYTKTVHRLVANAAFGYYGIQTDGLLVMHLDETRTNSCIDNLAIGTNKENGNFPKAKQRNSESKKGDKNYMFGRRHSEESRKRMSEAKKGEPNIKLSKPVGAYKNEELILKFESISEAGRNGFNSGLVSACCIGRRRVHKGYFWEYIK